METDTDAFFLAWDELKVEVEEMLLPQVRVVPIGSTVEMRDLGDRKNWIVRVVDQDGKDLADVWFGTDGDNGWRWDGLVRIGESDPQSKKGNIVWQTFQRYSDGSYRRIDAAVVTKTSDPSKGMGF